MLRLDFCHFSVVVYIHETKLWGGFICVQVELNEIFLDIHGSYSYRSNPRRWSGMTPRDAEYDTSGPVVFHRNHYFDSSRVLRMVSRSASISSSSSVRMLI